MEKTLKKICGMLKSDDARRSAAALVLAELAPKNAEVVKQLGQALQDAGPTASGHILDAMHAIGSKAAIPYVMPLLRSESMSVRMRAIAVAASAGTAVAPEIKRTLSQSTRQEKLISIDLLARIPKPQTYAVLLDIITQADFGLAKETCEAVQRHISSASPEARLALHKHVVAFMKTAKAKQQDRVLTSCLLLLGHIGRREAVTVLLKYAVPTKKTSASKLKVHLRRDPNYIRRHALIGLKGLDLTGAAAQNLVTKVLPYLDDPDEDIMRQALGIVSRLPAGGITMARWRKLLKNRHSSVRSYATRKLADNDTADTNRLLLDLLGRGDNDVCDIAAAALSRHKKAVPLLLQALNSAKTLDDAWRFARILKPHSEAIDKKTVTKFTKLVTKETLAATPRGEALAYFLRNIDVKASEAVLLDVGLQHKKAKRWRPAIDSLRRLLHTESWNADVSYDLSVCDLKLSHKELAPQLRAKDYALRGFQSLVRQSPADLLKRLTKDRILDASDLYYVGFHFTEGSTEYTEFGDDLLRAVAKKWPRSKEGKAVPKKLKKTRPPSKKAVQPRPPAAKKATSSKKRPAAKKKSVAKKGTPAKKRPATKKKAAKKKRS